MNTVSCNYHAAQDEQYAPTLEYVDTTLNAAPYYRLRLSWDVCIFATREQLAKLAEVIDAGIQPAETAACVSIAQMEAEWADQKVESDAD